MECLDIAYINKSLKLTQRSMCRTVDRQFPPSRKEALQREDRVVRQRCKWSSHKDNRRKERRRAGTMFPVNHLGVNTFNIEVMNSSSYQCISFPLNGTFSIRQ